MLNYTKDFIEMAYKEYSLLKIQVESLKKQDGGLLLRINELTGLVKDIATDNAALIEDNNKFKDLLDSIRVELVALRYAAVSLEYIIKRINEYKNITS